MAQLNADLAALLFSGDPDQYCKETLYFCEFSGGGGPDPLSPPPSGSAHGSISYDKKEPPNSMASYIDIMEYSWISMPLIQIIVFFESWQGGVFNFGTAQSVAKFSC